ncbi:hypothetical protein IQ07DRAFT_531020 [Pyrenochaeta sp. DS3sAY3a]|nr:hypothetical protein IQ07DRAFT_531020 [Pyrenochaeta sp. DS3sAY3a]
MSSATGSGTYPLGGIRGHHEIDQADPQGVSKKRRINAISHQANFPRKRSVTACQLCRTRKTKCDNRLPVCSKCLELGAKCLYQDQPSSESSENQVLDRLEYLISLVETRTSPLHIAELKRQSSSGGAEEVGDASTQPSPCDHNPHRTSTVTEISQTSAKIAKDNIAPIPGHEYFGSSEDILEWPIFQGRYDRRWIEARIFDPTLPCDDIYGTSHTPNFNDNTTPNKCGVARQNSSSGPGVREEDVPQLIETFLLNVHVKNPIFDPEYLRKMAKAVVEDGFDWKASSCLVLIVCALAAISSSFARHPTSHAQKGQEHTDNSLSNTSGYHTAEAYYTASRKRIGLLSNNLLATECYFMFGVYEMYSLRPLQAAISFNRACVTFQTLIWMNPEYQITDSLLSKARASRLYWSCLKSEHEVSVEFRFPASGLTKLNYTSHFPQPPLATSTEQLYRIHTDPDAEPRATPSVSVHNELETGWYYYLADIAARRILQRVIQSFYESSESNWIYLPLQDILHTAEELDRQLTEWYLTLPNIISSEMDIPAENELAFHLQARAIEIKERIYRPFLYLMIYKTLEASERDTILPLVEVHVLTCSRLISQWNVRHRHHGTWLMARQSFACALLLLAARKTGLHEQSQERYDSSVRASLSTLRYWEDEAPDLKASRLILEDIIQQM